MKITKHYVVKDSLIIGFCLKTVEDCINAGRSYSDEYVRFNVEDFNRPDGNIEIVVHLQESQLPELQEHMAFYALKEY